ncbi:DEAD-box ATP-dependent RNA helicase [Dirofilaria immitis]
MAIVVKESNRLNWICHYFCCHSALHLFFFTVQWIRYFNSKYTAPKTKDRSFEMDIFFLNINAKWTRKSVSHITKQRWNSLNVASF